MSKFTQQELMAAHNIARHSAEVNATENASVAKVPELIDPYREAQPWPDTEHPFGNNINNQRVAERIAKHQASLVGDDDSVSVPVSPLQAALADLKKAAIQGELEGKALTEAELEALQDADLSNALKAGFEKAKAGDGPEPAVPDEAPVPVKAPPAPKTPPVWKPKA